MNENDKLPSHPFADASLQKDQGKSAAAVRNILEEYFELLEQHLAAERAAFEKAHIVDWQDVLSFSSDRFHAEFNSGLVVHDTRYGHVPPIIYRIGNLLQSVSDFWTCFGETLYSAIASSDALCCAFTDSESLETERIIKSHGLYFDTVCLRDPLYHLSMTVEPRDAESLYQFGHGVLFQYLLLISRKRLFVSDSEYLISVLYPGVSDPEIFNQLGKSARDKTRLFSSELCGKEFSDTEELLAHFANSSFQDMYSLMSARLLPMFCIDLKEKLEKPNTESTFEEQLNFAVYSSRVKAGMPRLPALKGAQSLHVACFRSIQILEIENYECARLRADQSLDCQTWELYKWGLPTDARNFARSCGLPEANVALRAFDLPDLQWIFHVSIDELVRLREKGQMEELRSIFRANRKRLKTATVEDFDRLAGEVIKNIESALLEHSQRIQQEKLELTKGMQKSLASFAVGAGLSIASISLPALLPLGLISLAYSALLGSKSVLDMLNQHLSGKSTMATLSERPIGILWQAKKASRGPVAWRSLTL